MPTIPSDWFDGFDTSLTVFIHQNQATDLTGQVTFDYYEDVAAVAESYRSAWAALPTGFTGSTAGVIANDNSISAHGPGLRFISEAVKTSSTVFEPHERSTVYVFTQETSFLIRAEDAYPLDYVPPELDSIDWVAIEYDGDPEFLGWSSQAVDVLVNGHESWGHTDGVVAAVSPDTVHLRIMARTHTDPSLDPYYVNYADATLLNTIDITPPATAPTAGTQAPNYTLSGVIDLSGLTAPRLQVVVQNDYLDATPFPKLETDIAAPADNTVTSRTFVFDSFILRPGSSSGYPTFQAAFRFPRWRYLMDAPPLPGGFWGVRL